MIEGERLRRWEGGKARSKRHTAHGAGNLEKGERV
jgi:hypothetical protein